MTKQEQIDLKKKIKEYSAKIPELSPDDLVFVYKICLSKSSAQEKLLYKPLITLIEKERKARDLVQYIDSKIVPISSKSSKVSKISKGNKSKVQAKNKNGASADDY